MSSELPATSIANLSHHSDSAEEAAVVLKSSSIDTINYISSDSASTFEYVDEKLYHQQLYDRHNDEEDDGLAPPMASTKEEKQRHNEEIAEMAQNAWEPVPKTAADESCLLFLRSERNLADINSTPSKSAKPCFIDASSLLDEEDLIYTPPPSAAHRPYGAVNVNLLQRSFAAEDKDDDRTPTSYDIKDQYSANVDKTPVSSRSPHVYSPVRMMSRGENEKLQGNMIFASSIQHFSGHAMKPQMIDDTSDMSSLQSAYSSASGSGHHDHPPHYAETTSDYHSSFSRTSGDSSIVLPETPFNSIVQVQQQLKIFEEGDDCVDDDDFVLLEAQKSPPATTNPMKIPKRSMKYDEFAPVLSGGASVKDFTPKQSESPNLRRKTDTCPIVSGGSVDISAETMKQPRAAQRRSSAASSHSWIVDFNELKINEDGDGDDGKRKQLNSGAKSLDYATISQPPSMGFYVDFGSLRESSTESSEEKIRREPPRPAPRQKPTGFYVDLTSPVAVEGEKRSLAVAEPAVKQVETNGSLAEKKNMFSMFIDFTAGAENGTKIEATPPPPQSAPATTKEEKKSCYMFIESDSPVVRRRQLAMSADTATKRHSWNVAPADEPSEAQRAAKCAYQRSTSVNAAEKGSIMLSKTSSMSIDSSVSPYEDFSCSKSFSSYSATSHSTSNSSIEQSSGGTKLVQQVEGGEVPAIMTASAKKRRRDAKLNETFDKSSQGSSSATEGVLSQDDCASTSTDTDDVTFQNQEEDANNELKRDPSTSDFKAAAPVKMETIPEIAESSPMKRVKPTTLALTSTNEPSQQPNEDFKIETHTMESLQALIEKQKQLLETNADSPATVSVSSFVKLSDLDKPIKQNIYEKESTATSAVMTNSAKVSRLFSSDATPAGHRSLTLQNEKTQHSWNMSRSTGNNSLSTLASSVENFRSLTRLFPHLTDVISTSVPNNVSMNSFDQSFIDRLEFISSDFSCTSSVTSSRSGMDSADESSMSCRQPKRLGEDLLKMFVQELGTDVTIEVGNRKMKAHKCILRSRCQYFAAILAGNWVSHTGNVISLHGYSYSAVHFALCHIYSGASHPPEGISLMELASLSDLLGLEGLKEVTTFALRTNYCHNFHKPCSGCIDGITQVLPVTLNHGLDELYRKCLKWVCKNFQRVWLTKQFAALNPDIHARCRQQIAAHFTSENVLHWIVECDDMLKSLEACRWSVRDVDNLTRDILDSAHGYVMDHFASLIASDSFLSLGHGEKSTIARLENLLLRTAAALSADQACRSYPRAVRLNQLLTAKIILPNPLSSESLQTMDRMSAKIHLRDEEDSLGWHEDFVHLVSALMTAIEQNLIRQCSKAMRCSAWQRMDADLRSKMQKLACLTDTDDNLRKLRSSASSTASARNYSVSSSVSSRTNDLRQVKLAIQAHNRKLHGGYENSNIPVIKRTAPVTATNTNYPVTKASTRTNIPETKLIQHKRSHSEEASQRSTGSGKHLEVKSRYMEPKKPKTPLLDQRASARLRIKPNMSSSESSTRGSSPAFARRQINNLNVAQQVKKSSNLSLDSLQSPLKSAKSLASKKITSTVDHNSALSIDSLVELSKPATTYSNESLVKVKNRNLTDETKLKKKSIATVVVTATSTARSAAKHMQSSSSSQVRTSFLSQKSREILARREHNKERKHSTNSTSSLATTRSNETVSPRMHEINKSNSSASMVSRASSGGGRKVYSTTLHLRKTVASSMSDASDASSRRELNRRSNVKTSSAPAATKSTAVRKSSSSAAVLNGHNKKPKSIVNGGRDKKSLTTTKKQPPPAPLAHPDEEVDEIIAAAKMARSNTFSKEKSDNPLELLKIMN